MSEEGIKSFHCPFDVCSDGQVCSFYEKKSFKKKSFLDQHLLNRHSERKFKCPNCQKQYAIEWQLRYHLKSSCGRDWQCLTCKKVYTQRLSLMVHCNRNGHRFPDHPKSYKNPLNHESQNSKYFIVPMYLNLSNVNGNLYNVMNSNLNNDFNTQNSNFNYESIVNNESNHHNFNDKLRVPLLIKRNENKFRPILPKNDQQSIDNSKSENTISTNNLLQIVIDDNFKKNEFIEHQLKSSNQLSIMKNLNLNNLIDGSSQTDDHCLCLPIKNNPTMPTTNLLNYQIINNQINDRMINQMDKSVQCPEIFDLATSTRRIVNRSKPVLKNQSTCTEINSDTVSNLKRKSVASETTINNLNRNYCFFYDQNTQSNHLNQNFINYNQIDSSLMFRNVQTNLDQQLSNNQQTFSMINQPETNQLNNQIYNSDLFANSVINYSTNNLATREDPLLSTISVQTDSDYCVNDQLINPNHLNELDLGLNDIHTLWNFNDNMTQTDYAFDIDNFFI